MPTQRRSGAALLPISLVTPAFKGLNKQAESALLGPEWATEALNAVFDTSNRLSARSGWLTQTSSPMSGTPTVEQLHELVKEDGTTQILSAAGSKIWRDVSAPTDITGTATITVGNNWQFVNFNGRALGFQQGEQPIDYNGTTSFADLVAASGTAPTGNCAVVHSGRIWAADSDRQTIKYCALLDQTHWTTGAGSIDMSSVWPQGTDEIVALAFYNGQMVVFGKNKIVFFGDTDGYAFGIDPANIYVTDTIVGVGCIARDSIQQIENGDLLFLSYQGVQSLQRVIQERSNPINNVSQNVRDYLNGMAATETKSLVRTVYSPENAFYLLVLPTSEVTFCFDTSGRLEDGSFRVTEWNNLVPRSIVRALDGTVYIGLKSGAGGEIGKYTGNQDDGAEYTFSYASGWLDLGEEAASYLKILKSVTGLFWITDSATILFRWDVDFQGDFSSSSFTLTASSGAEWGEGEWGEDEFGGGLNLRPASAPLDGAGQFIRIGIVSSINGSSVAIQQLNLFAKIGRLAK
jgi:hypothetical protein